MITAAQCTRRIRVALLACLAAAPSVSAAAPPPKDALSLPRAGFACCNLHIEGDWISDGNYAGLPMLKVGTPIRVVSLGRHKAYVEIDGRKLRLGHDYGRDQESLGQWVSKIVATEDPRPRIATYPEDVQGAIREGKVLVGMTREQAIASVGYPLTSETPALDGPLWRHWVSSFEEYQLRWGADGRLAEVIAEAPVRSRVVYAPPN